MTSTDSASKISARHQARKAVVYLRQSSIAQVRAHVESTRLQYALKDTAIAYGFAQVEVIDVDLGMSAASGARSREGFKQLLASVALGEVGMVLSREPSRLSRTDKDWCHLMELCRVLDTLIGDADNIYDLNRLDDQLLLGIKGTLSVLELGTLKLRMQQGREAKARRGELGRVLAPGYVMDADQRIVKDPNLRVQQAMGMVFSRFDVLGSIRCRQSLGDTGRGRAKADLYRQDYRHFEEVQRWRGFPGDRRGMHLSGAIEDYRVLRGLERECRLIQASHPLCGGPYRHDTRNPLSHRNFQAAYLPSTCSHTLSARPRTSRLPLAMER